MAEKPVIVTVYEDAKAGRAHRWVVLFRFLDTSARSTYDSEEKALGAARRSFPGVDLLLVECGHTCYRGEAELADQQSPMREPADGLDLVTRTVRDINARHEERTRG